MSSMQPTLAELDAALVAVVRRHPSASADPLVSAFLVDLLGALERAVAGVEAGVEPALLAPFAERVAGWIEGLDDGLRRWFGDEASAGAVATRQLTRFRDRVGEWSEQLARELDDLLQETAAPDSAALLRWRLSWLPRPMRLDECERPLPRQALLRALGGDADALAEALLDRLLAGASLAALPDEDGVVYLGSGREHALVYRAKWTEGGRGPTGAPVAVRVAAGGHARPTLRPSSPFVLTRYGGMRALGFGVEALELFAGRALDRVVGHATEGERMWIGFQLVDGLRALHADRQLDTLPSTDDVLVAEGSWGSVVRLRAGHGGPPMGEEAETTAVAVLVGGVLGAEYSETVAELVDGPEPLAEKLDKLLLELGAALARRPRFQLGDLATRAMQIQAYFTGLCEAVDTLALAAADAGWPLVARPADEALDTSMGDPETATDLVDAIETEVIPFFARPYQIALMGVFSSGKTFLINKLLLRMAGLPLAPYAPEPAYREDPRYAEIAPYLRRSTAEPTDTVVTIIRAPGRPGDEQRQETLKQLIPQERPEWPEDPLELPVPLEELTRFNLIDTPGLNEDLTVNKRVGGFLQSCDLIVYVFTATAVMNSQDHFLIRRKHEVAPNKRMIFAINMIDTLVNRIRHTAFWDEEHQPAVVKATLPLRTRIKAEVEGITGEAPPLTLGDDLWVLSGMYDYNVERLYAHLVATIERTASLDRLAGTPGVMRAHLDWARGFARRQVSRALRPRLSLVEGVLAELERTFERELPRRIGDDWEKALGDFHRRHALADRPYGQPEVGEPAEPAAAGSWAERLGSATWGLEGRTDADFAALTRLRDAGEAVGAAADALLAPLGLEALTAGLASAGEALGTAADAARSQIDRALDEFVDSTLPARASAAQTALGREIGRVCEEALEALTAGYRRELGATFGRSDEPEGPAASALIGESETTGDEAAAGSALVDRERAGLHARIAEDRAALASAVEALSAQVAGARGRLVAALTAALDEARAADGEGGQLESRAKAAVEREAARVAGGQIARWGGPALAAVLLLVAPIVGGVGAAVLAVLGLAAAGGGWWLRQTYESAMAERRAADEAELAERWGRLLSSLDAREATARTVLASEVDGWRLALERLAADAAARGEALAGSYRALFLELYRGESLARWTEGVGELADERLAPLRGLRRQLAKAVAECDAIGLRLAAGPVALDIDAFEALSRVHQLARREGDGA